MIMSSTRSSLSGPGTPVGPLDPARPILPRRPIGPVRPAAPVGPRGPRFPVAPFGPGRPCDTRPTARLRAVRDDLATSPPCDTLRKYATDFAGRRRYG